MDTEKILAKGFAVANDFCVFDKHPEHAGVISMVLGCQACRDFLISVMHEARMMRNVDVVIDEGD
jgi:hypothetical protein